MTIKLPIYLDNASTTPVDERVLNQMLPFFSENFGNASSKDHILGNKAKSAIENSREQIAALLGAESEEIVFTSGATEATNLGIIGYFLYNRNRGNHIITVGTEHKAVLETFSYLESIGASLSFLEVNKSGLIDLEELRSVIKDDTILVSVMFVNNETGVIQNIEKISAICFDKGVSFFCDASQAAGKIEIDLKKVPIDMLVLSGHKMYGPKGVGALYIKNGIVIQPILYGGGQERNYRPGTYNTPLIVGLGYACDFANNEIIENYSLVSKVRNYFEELILSRDIGEVFVSNVERSPYISSIMLKRISAEDFILWNRNNICISSGSACNSEIVEPSHVIMQICADQSIAERTVRFSFSKYTSIVDLKDLKLTT